MGRYTVRKNCVLSYADIKLYFKKVQFASRNTTIEIYNANNYIFMRVQMFVSHTTQSFD